MSQRRRRKQGRRLRRGSKEGGVLSRANMIECFGGHKMGRERATVHPPSFSPICGAREGDSAPSPAFNYVIRGHCKSSFHSALIPLH